MGCQETNNDLTITTLTRKSIVELRPCPTRDLRLHGAVDEPSEYDLYARYGADAGAVRTLANTEPGGSDLVHPALDLTEAEVRWACRKEMARRVDDVLARRSRSLLFDAAAALQAAPRVAEIMAEELGRDAAWQRREIAAFTEVAKRHHVPDAG